MLKKKWSRANSATSSERSRVAGDTYLVWICTRPPYALSISELWEPPDYPVIHQLRAVDTRNGAIRFQKPASSVTQKHPGGALEPRARPARQIASAGGRNQPRTYLLNQSIVRCQARSAAALLYRSGV